MLEKVLESLLSPGGLWLLASLAVLLLVWVAKKWPQKNIDGLVYKAFSWVEKAIPDDTPNKSMAKLDAFMKKFIEAYTQRFGTLPSKKELGAAEDKVEALVVAKNAKKDG